MLESFKLLFESAHLQVFSVCIAAVLAYLVVEVLSLLVTGYSSLAGDGLDGALFDVEPVDKAMNFLLVKELPLMFAMCILFLSFGSVGLMAQFLAESATGNFMPLWAAIPVALVGGYAVFRGVAKTISRNLFHVEKRLRATQYVGQLATAVEQIDDSCAGLCQIKDESGVTHNVLVKPNEPNLVINVGDVVELVAKLDETVFAGKIHRAAAPTA